MSMIFDRVLTSRPDDGKEPRTPSARLSGRAAQQAILAQILDELVHIRETTTAQAARLGGQVVNSVLEVATKVFPTDGHITLDFPVAAGSIEVTNNGAAANIVTVTSQGWRGDAPAEGIGVYRIPGGQARTVNVASRHITLYGTAADSVSYQVFAAGATPVAG